MRGLIFGLAVLLPTAAMSMDIHVKDGTYTCSNSAVFRQFARLDTADQKEFDRILSGGNCFVTASATALTVVREYPDMLLVTLDEAPWGLAAEFVRKVDVLP